MTHGTATYFNDFRDGDLLIYPDKTTPGFKAWNTTLYVSDTSTSIDIQAHQGYSANTAGTLHYLTDDKFDTTGKITIWNDNGPSDWTINLNKPGIEDEINLSTGATPINHIGGCAYFDDGGAGLLYIAIGSFPAKTNNGIAIYNATTLDIVDVFIMETSDAFDFAGVAVHNNELYFCSFVKSAVAEVKVYDQTTRNFKRNIKFNVDGPLPDGKQGISVDSTGSIHISCGASIVGPSKDISVYYRFSPTGDLEASYRRRGTSHQGAEDIEVRNGEIRILYDAGATAAVRGQPLPFESRGSVSSAGVSTNDSAIYISDTVNLALPTQFTMFEEVKADRLFDFNSSLSIAENQFHFKTWVNAAGQFNFRPENSNTITSSVGSIVVDQVYTIALMMDVQGGIIVKANVWIDGVSVGEITPGVTQTIVSPASYGFGVLNEFDATSEWTLSRLMIFNEVLTNEEIENFVWPIPGEIINPITPNFLEAPLFTFTTA